MLDNPMTRRAFVKGAAASLLSSAALSADEPRPPRSLKGELGITTGSFMAHLSPTPAPGKLVLLDLPGIMHNELGMHVIDLMTRTLASEEPAYLDDLRRRAERNGCVLTNLKMNQTVDMASSDTDSRRAAIVEYKRTIDIAQRLGCRWVRPAPGAKRPDMKLLAAGYRELVDYAAPKGISLLVENNGWMQSDADAIPETLKAVGPGVAACPDTGNWTDAVRYEALQRAFPHAVTCDFKAFQLAPDGTHDRYDLRRCFQIGWDAGFRGPWCFEHFNQTLDGLWKGFASLRDMLKTWIAEQAAK